MTFFGPDSLIKSLNYCSVVENKIVIIFNRNKRDAECGKHINSHNTVLFSPLFANSVKLYPSPQRPSREINLKAFLLDLDLNINKYNVAIVMSPPYQKLFLDVANNRPI